MLLKMHVVFHVLAIVPAMTWGSLSRPSHLDPTRTCNLLPEDSDCGPVKPGPDIAIRVVGGHPARLGEYPWMTLLFLNSGSFCDGSIIDENTILTAAHCCVLVEGHQMSIRVGEYDTATERDCPPEGECAPPVQNIHVSDVIVHEAYNGTTFHNDICLLRLKGPIKFNDYVKPICLPKSKEVLNTILSNSRLDVAGWGQENNNPDSRPTILQTLSVSTFPLPQCTIIYKHTPCPVTDMQICTGGLAGKGPCHGDSGGPLMGVYSVDQLPPRYYLVGIVSHGLTRLCGIKGEPAVYTNVHKYIDWIEQHKH